jgi:hypothetical protein
MPSRQIALQGRHTGAPEALAAELGHLAECDRRLGGVNASEFSGASDVFDLKTNFRVGRRLACSVRASPARTSQEAVANSWFLSNACARA